MPPIQAIIYMTKQTDSYRQAGRDRPVLEIEITPAMIEAGQDLIAEYLGDVPYSSSHINSLLCSLYSVGARAVSRRVHIREA